MSSKIIYDDILDCTQAATPKQRQEEITKWAEEALNRIASGSGKIIILGGAWNPDYHPPLRVQDAWKEYWGMVPRYLHALDKWPVESWENEGGRV